MTIEHALGRLTLAIQPDNRNHQMNFIRSNPQRSAWLAILAALVAFFIVKRTK